MKERNIKRQRPGQIGMEKKVLKKKIFVAMLAGLLWVPGVQAETLCGVEGKGKYNPAKTFNHVLGSCKAGGACVILAAGRVPGAEKPAVNFLLMQRDSRSAKWTIRLTTQSVSIDLSEGLEFIVDDKEPMRVPPEFLSAGQKLINAQVDQKLTQILIDAFSGAKNMKLNVTQKDASKASLLYRLGGMRDAIKWFDCAQK